MSLSLAVLTGQGEEGFHPHEAQLLVFSCLWLYYDKLFLFSCTDFVYGFVLTRCFEFIDAFAGYLILCKAAVNVHKVVFSFFPSR